MSGKHASQYYCYFFIRNVFIADYLYRILRQQLLVGTVLPVWKWAFVRFGVGFRKTVVDDVQLRS